MWVTFELGRPLGPPNDPEFQRGVLRSALNLLRAEHGPVLEDYPHDAPEREDEQQAWACPVNFAPQERQLKGAERVTHLLLEEIAALQPWYERGFGQTKRTIVGASSLNLDVIAKLLGDLFEPELPGSPLTDMPLSEVIRLALEDLKAFYFEAATAQPGNASAAELRRWFWNDTQASTILREIGERLQKSGDPNLQIIGQVFVVPRAEV